MYIREVVIITLGSLLALAILSFLILGSIAFYKTQKGTAKSFGLMFQRGSFLRMATVILIVTSTVFLALVDIIKENGVIGIFSGIAGYVLGGLEQNKKDDKNEEIE